MLKLLGAIMIVGACTIMGVSINRKLYDRIRILQELLVVIQEIKSEIIFRSAPVLEIFLRFSRKESYFTANYFQSICENLQQFGLQIAARQAMEELHRLPLTESDLAELSHVFDALGRYDVPTQAEALSRVIAALEFQLADAKLQYSQKGKLYQAVGISCGIALALVAI